MPKRKKKSSHRAAENANDWYGYVAGSQEMYVQRQATHKDRHADARSDSDETSTDPEEVLISILRITFAKRMIVDIVIDDNKSKWGETRLPRGIVHADKAGPRINDPYQNGDKEWVYCDVDSHNYVDSIGYNHVYSTKLLKK